MSWFKSEFGFKERAYDETRALFSTEGDELVCGTKRWHIGPFECPSVEEMRSRVAITDESDSCGGIRFEHVSGDVTSLILDERNAGAVFQAASQFNCLEMIDPSITPRHGVSRYVDDPTQGPKVALACPAATVFRNYLVNGVGQGREQVDCLRDVGGVFGAAGSFWSMRNGYCLPTHRTAMRELGAVLDRHEALVGQAEAKLRVGVHWDTQVMHFLMHTWQQPNT